MKIIKISDKNFDHLREILQKEMNIVELQYKKYSNIAMNYEEYHDKENLTVQQAEKYMNDYLETYHKTNQLILEINKQ
ncbi:hypothetical protein [Bacillus sp. V59.32b]|uniref:hypothetical protein n=1 Tax=Bacillus sp. V59.32b TaxID=1758642 RepID=UPI000E3C3A7F|nr:hypothetical protein [Bacillus sp. V59.32b]RFU70022.1 hypothetical protein D0463_00675 [Bacillus sp. V59.32b]